jgi:hypothetical protein
MYENIQLNVYILVKNGRSNDKNLSFGIIKTSRYTLDKNKVYYNYIYPEDFGYASRMLRLIDLEVFPDEYEDDDGNLWRFLFTSDNLEEVKKEYNIHTQVGKFNL